jgi:hypothetical protein
MACPTYFMVPEEQPVGIGAPEQAFPRGCCAISQTRD